MGDARVLLACTMQAATEGESSLAEESSSERVQAEILRLLARRNPESTICPSEVARAVAPDHWRTLMPVVRKAACALTLAGTIEITQRGQAIVPDGTWRGAIRLRRAHFTAK